VPIERQQPTVDMSLGVDKTNLVEVISSTQSHNYLFPKICTKNTFIMKATPVPTQPLAPPKGGASAVEAAEAPKQAPVPGDKCPACESVS
jgi:hypothetical protein